MAIVAAAGGIGTCHFSEKGWRLHKKGFAAGIAAETVFLGISWYFFGDRIKDFFEDRNESGRSQIFLQVDDTARIQHRPNFSGQMHAYPSPEISSLS